MQGEDKHFCNAVLTCIWSPLKVGDYTMKLPLNEETDEKCRDLRATYF